MKNIKVAAGIIRSNGKVLITRRAPKEKMAGGWEFPGGKIEKNESEEECLVRELKEELDITVCVDKFCIKTIYDYGDIYLDLRAHYCSIIGGTIKLSVHDQYEWVGIKELLKYNLLPADVSIAERVMEEYNEQFL